MQLRTLEPKVRYPNTATISKVIIADPIEPPMTVFILAWVFDLSSLKMGNSCVTMLVSNAVN